MDLNTTLIAAVGALAAAAFFGWRGARSPDFARGPRLIPYQGLMLVAVGAALLLITHVVNLLGAHTGG
jgi:hypothetical protein